MSQETALTRARRRSCSASRSWARASSSTPTSSPAARPAAARRWACRACATSTPGCVGAYLVEHDLFDFLLLSLPDNDTHSHKNGPHAQSTSIAAADAQLVRVVEAGGGPRRFLDEHAVIVVADHSHARVERRIDCAAPSPSWEVAGPGGAAAERRPRSRCARRSARRWSTPAARGARDARRPARSSRPRGRSRASTSSSGRDGDAGRDRGAGARRAALRARAATGPSTTPAAALDGRRRARRAATRRRRDGALRSDRLPRRAAPRVGGADLRDLGRRAAVRRARLRVPRLGRRRPRRRRQPRLAAPRRLARRAGVLRRRRARRRARTGRGRSPTSRRWCRPTSAPASPSGQDGRVALRASARRASTGCAGATACATALRQARQLVAAGPLRRGRRERLRRQPGDVRALRPRAATSTTGRRRDRVPRRGRRTTSSGTGTGRSTRAPATPATRPRASSSCQLAAFGFNFVLLVVAGRGRRTEGGRRAGDRDRRRDAVNFIGNKLWSFTE